MWTKIHQPHYIEKEPKAKSNFEVKYVEVFRNNEYYGVYGNGLFNRLLELNPNGYKEKVKARWMALRETYFSNETLMSKIDEIYTKFTEEKVYEREQLV